MSGEILRLLVVSQEKLCHYFQFKVQFISLSPSLPKMSFTPWYIILLLSFLAEQIDLMLFSHMLFCSPVEAARRGRSPPPQSKRSSPPPRCDIISNLSTHLCDIKFFDFLENVHKDSKFFLQFAFVFCFGLITALVKTVP